MFSTVFAMNTQTHIRLQLDRFKSHNTLTILTNTLRWTTQNPLPTSNDRVYLIRSTSSSGTKILHGAAQWTQVTNIIRNSHSRTPSPNGDVRHQQKAATVIKDLLWLVYIPLQTKRPYDTHYYCCISTGVAAPGSRRENYYRKFLHGVLT